MASLPDLSTQPIQGFFFGPTDTKLHQFLSEAHQVVQFAPAILDRIEGELQPKKSRTTISVMINATGKTSDIDQLMRLKSPARLEPYVVYLFLPWDGGRRKDQHRAVAAGGIDDLASVAGRWACVCRRPARSVRTSTR